METTQKLMYKEGKDDKPDFFVNFVAGGVSAGLAKSITAPVERVKLIIQTQDCNPLIVNGSVPRYKGMLDCFSRVYEEQGMKSFWRGNFTNVIRYFPTQAFNFAFKDKIRSLFPQLHPVSDFWRKLGLNVASGGLAGAGALCIVYPLDYARTRLAIDVGSHSRSFKGLSDCLLKTALGPGGIKSLYTG